MKLVHRFFKFVVPSIVSMWIFSLYTMVDGMFVARGVGEHALAAVNLSMPFTSLVFTLGILLATGTSTVLSIALGQGDLERARNYFNQNLWVTGGASVLLGIAVLLNLERVALFLGATPATLDYVKEYVGAIACFAACFTISYNLEVQVKANGAPQVSTIGVLSCALMNVGLDALFVLVFRWGVWGAALATGLAQATSVAVFFLYFLTHRERLRLGRFRPDLRIYRRILPLGLSDGLSECSNGIIIFLFNQTILRVIGEDAVVSYTIISYVNTLVLMTMIGAAQGIQPLVSFHLGAGERPGCLPALWADPGGPVLRGVLRRRVAGGPGGGGALPSGGGGAVCLLRQRPAAVRPGVPGDGLQRTAGGLLYRRGAANRLLYHLLQPGSGPAGRVPGAPVLPLWGGGHLDFPPGVRGSVPGPDGGVFPPLRPLPPPNPRTGVENPTARSPHPGRLRAACFGLQGPGSGAAQDIPFHGQPHAARFVAGGEVLRGPLGPL